MLSSINTTNMYLNESMYTSKIEKETKSGNRITEMCCYELSGGGYLVITRVKEEIERDYGKDYKTVSEEAYACTGAPVLETKDDALSKLKQFAESLTNG